MYLVYADESGDTGLIKPGGTQHFVISGVLIHETNWNQLFADLVTLRRDLRKRFGVPQRIAFHATDMVNGHGDFHHSQHGMSTQDSCDMYRQILDFCAQQVGILHFLHVFIRKPLIKKRDLDVFEWAWKIFIQRVHNMLDPRGELHRGDECAILITDRTHDDHLRKIMREMRAYNPIAKKYGGGAFNILVRRLLDDPVPRNSSHSYLIQLADLAAYALARRDLPRDKLKPYKFETYFDILDPVLLKSASNSDPQGVVYFP